MSKPQVRYKPGGVEGKDGKQLTTQQDAWKKEADCGCGIDCCNKQFVIEDQTTGNKILLYVDNGVLTAEDTVTGNTFTGTLSGD